MRCPNCGTENRPGARFCRQCAGPLAGFAAPGGPASVQGSPTFSLTVQSGHQFIHRKLFILKDQIFNGDQRISDVNDGDSSESSLSLNG